MKYITRELYQGMQGAPEPAEDFDARWRRACDAYAAHLDGISGALPPRMAALARATLHDGRVLAVRRPAPAELILDVDATTNPWGPAGVFRLRFTGVRRAAGAGDDLVGDDWLYEEAHLHPEARFDFRVLFWRHDFRVVADDVEVTALGPGRT
jgi:hypothetical protein